MKKGLFVFIFFLLVCFSLVVSANLLDDYNSFVNDVKTKFLEGERGNFGAITGYDVYDESLSGEEPNPFLTNFLGSETPTGELPDVVTSPADIALPLT